MRTAHRAARRSQVETDEAAARLEYAAKLRKSRGQIGNVAQHETVHDKIEGCVGERQPHRIPGGERDLPVETQRRGFAHGVFDHLDAEVGGDDGARTLTYHFQRELSGASGNIEPDGCLRLGHRDSLAPPAPVEA